MYLIFQMAITNSIPSDGTLIAVIPPAKGLEYFAHFFSKEPLGARRVKTLPLGLRLIRKDNGKLQLVVSGLEFAWGVDGNHNLLPEEFFIGEKNSFGKKVNKILHYDAVQRSDYIHGILNYPEQVSFEPLLKPVIVMNSNGFVAHDYLLRGLLKYCRSGNMIISQILEVVPSAMRERIFTLFGKRFSSG